MFAAAAIVLQTAFRASLEAAKFLATKALMVAIIAIVLPWAIKPVFIYAFEWIVKYGRTYGDLIMGFINSQTSTAGIDLNLTITGVGGFLAEQTGLIDYCSIIISGWGIYWTLAILAKTPGIR